MITMSQRRGMAVIAITAILLAACGGETSTESATGSDGAVSVNADTEPTSTTSEVTASSDPKTLDEYLGAAANAVRGGGGQAGFDSEERLEEQRLVQQEIQICMQAQGFSYVPEEVGTGLRFFIATERSTIAADEYAETEGFGISTAFDTIRENEADLTESTNANDDHLATLSEGEADAWQLALRGTPPERNEQGQLIDPETGTVIQGRGQATGGCTLQAQEAVRGDFAALGELQAEFAELEERIDADPRIAELSRSWTDCMMTEGFDFQDEAEARAEIRSQVRPLLRSFFQGQGQGDQAGEQQGQRQGGNQLQRIAGLELTDAQEAELDALQDLERSMAVASLTCQGGSADEIAEIRARYEAEFVEANQATLEAISQ